MQCLKEHLCLKNVYIISTFFIKCQTQENLNYKSKERDSLHCDNNEFSGLVTHIWIPQLVVAPRRFSRDRKLALPLSYICSCKVHFAFFSEQALKLQFCLQLHPDACRDASAELRSLLDGRQVKLQSGFICNPNPNESELKSYRTFYKNY